MTDFFARPISEGDGFEECPEMLVPLTTVEEGGEGSNKARGNQHSYIIFLDYRYILEAYSLFFQGMRLRWK